MSPRAQTPLAHPLQSIDWLGQGQHWFPHEGNLSITSNPNTEADSESQPQARQPKAESVDQPKPWNPPRVTLINAKAFTHKSMMQGSQCFCLQVMTPEATGWLATNIPGPTNLDRVPKEYHNFTDVFSKSKAGVLANHHPYNLDITLEERASPPSDRSTHCVRRSYSPSISSLMRIQPWELPVPHALHMEHQYYSYKRTTDPCDCVATFRG